MWINKKSLDWNPWDTDVWGKKRPCHIKGMQKMNEYHLQKQKQDHDKSQEEQKRQSRINKSRSSKSNSSDFAKMNYLDEDMKRLVTEGKGTTSSHSYQ